MLVYLVTPVMALVGAGEVGVPAVACHLAEELSMCALYEKV